MPIFILLSSIVGAKNWYACADEIDVDNEGSIQQYQLMLQNFNRF
jgi:hypothetical protein